MTSSAPLLVVAAGGLAREVLAALRRIDAYTVVGLLDDEPMRWGERRGDRPVLGGIEQVTEYPDAQIVLAAGRGRVRRDLAAKLTVLGVEPQRYATIVHPGADLAGATIGRGSVVLSGAVATADVEIGPHVVVMPNVTLTHDVVVESFATLCAGVSLGGSVRVGESAYVGMNAVIRENLHVGPGATVGMGAVVLHDVPAGETWIGVPAARHDAPAVLRSVPR